MNIERSLGGRRWVLRPVDHQRALATSQLLDVPEIVGRLLAGRGIDPHTADDFLRPTLKASLPDPSHMRDMDVAAARLAEAVRTKEPIAIFGDYDVDGAASAAVLGRFLSAVGAPPMVHIPDRDREGYGPNVPALLALKEQGARVVVTVDCGVSAFEPLAAAADLGLDVIVVDHHEAPTTLPAACAVVNPKRIDDDSPCTYLAAVGVVFLLVVAVNRLLRDGGWYGADHPGPDLMRWLDIVALGTVCDVVPLIGLNRALVAAGLKIMARRGNPGIVALAEMAGVAGERLTAHHLGYTLGPMINAGGRIGDASLGARLLATDNSEEAAALALRLQEYNTARRDIEAAALQEAVDRVETAGEAPLSFAVGEGWRSGVIGIVAGRLKERYHRPACVVTVQDGMAKGSGRSVVGIDLGRIIIAAREAGLLSAGGGHAMAAGFSLAVDALPEFKAFLSAGVTEQLEKNGGVCVDLELDGAIDLGAACSEFLNLLEPIGPFGAGNEHPRFVIPNVRVARADVVGRGHVRCFLTNAGGGRLKSVAFHCADSALGDALVNGAGGGLHVAGTLRRNVWRGRENCELIIDDAAWAQ